MLGRALAVPDGSDVRGAHGRPSNGMIVPEAHDAVMREIAEKAPGMWGLDRVGRALAADPEWRQHVLKESVRNTRDPAAGSGTEARERGGTAKMQETSE
jgi:hypothetical protein